MNYRRLAKFETGRCFPVEYESRESDTGDEFGGPSNTISRFCQVLILGLATLPLHTPISNRNSLMSKLQNLNMQVQGCQNVA